MPPWVSALGLARLNGGWVDRATGEYRDANSSRPRHVIEISGEEKITDLKGPIAAGRHARQEPVAGSNG